MHLFHSAIILITMTSYIVTTVYMNEWRKKFRRDMIEADNAFSDRSVNSLINFETGKTQTVNFFGALGAVTDASVLSLYLDSQVFRDGTA